MAKIDFFSLSAQRKRSKRKSCISHRHTTSGSAFSLIIKGKEEAWQKETSPGQLLIKSEQNPPHNIILEILTKLPTSTGLPAGRALQLGTVKGDKKRSLSVYSDWEVNLTNTLDLIQSIRYNASRSENFKYPQSKTLLP